jgi:hypothetical protein
MFWQQTRGQTTTITITITIVIINAGIRLEQVWRRAIGRPASVRFSAGEIFFPSPHRQGVSWNHAGPFLDSGYWRKVGKGRKSVLEWFWTLTSIQLAGMLELIICLPIFFHGVVFNSLSTGTIFLLIIEQKFASRTWGTPTELQICNFLLTPEVSMWRDKMDSVCFRSKATHNMRTWSRRSNYWRVAPSVSVIAGSASS